MAPINVVMAPTNAIVSATVPDTIAVIPVISYSFLIVNTVSIARVIQTVNQYLLVATNRILQQVPPFFVLVPSEG